MNEIQTESVGAQNTRVCTSCHFFFQVVNTEHLDIVGNAGKYQTVMNGMVFKHF